MKILQLTLISGVLLFSGCAAFEAFRTDDKKVEAVGGVIEEVVGNLGFPLAPFVASLVGGAFTMFVKKGDNSK